METEHRSKPTENANGIVHNHIPTFYTHAKYHTQHFVRKLLEMEMLEGR